MSSDTGVLTEASPAAHLRLDRRAWWAVAPALAILTWGGNQFTPLLLMYRRIEGYSQVQVDLFLALYVVGLVPGFLLCGPLSDRYGRKRMLAAGLALGAIASGVLAAGASVVTWMCVGRLIAGLSVAIAMVVGTSWIAELSPGPDGASGAGARRASMTLTVGFGAGAGVAGVLAQWAPAPTVLAYLVHIALCAVAAAFLARATDTRAYDARVRSLRADLRIPRRSRRRFVRVVLPIAPWVFASAGLAYALTPELVGARAGGDAVAFATLLTVVTLAAGAAIQPITRIIASRTGGRQSLVGIMLTAFGIVLCAVEAQVRSIALAVLVAAVFGLAYGVCLVAGLAEIRSMADVDDLGGVTGVYYSLTYVGFALPALLAGLAHFAPYLALLGGVASACLLCAGIVAHALATQGAPG